MIYLGKLLKEASTILAPVIYMFQTLSNVILWIVGPTLSYSTTRFGVRLNKSPYADSYWFLYTAKTSYYTTRYLTK